MTFRKTINTLFLAGLFAVTPALFSPVDNSYADETEKLIGHEFSGHEFSWEDAYHVPQSVRDYRISIAESQELEGCILVEFAHRMGLYMITPKDGSSIKRFARTHLGLNNEEIDEIIFVPPTGNFHEYGPAFRIASRHPLYDLIRSKANALDVNNNRVVTPEELTSSYP